MKEVALHAVLLLSCIFEISAGNLDLLLLHTNDMHGKFEEITPLANSCNELEKNRTCVGGFARLAHQIEKYRKWGEESSRKVLFLNAGDTFVGSDWYSVHKWKICSEFLNALKPEVMTLGNHEFDDGLDVLNQFVKSLNCPIVSSNIDVSKVEPVKKSVVLDINGTKIGIIGYLTRETAFQSNMGNLQMSEEVKAVTDESEKLDRQGVKIIIGLGHSGFKIDKQIAAEVPLIDVVIGGHSNTFLWNGPKPHKEDVEGPYPTVMTQKSGKKVPVVQAYAYTLYLGRLNVTFNENGELIEFGGQPEYMSSDITQNQDILNLLDKFRPAVDAVNKEVVGKSSVYLDGVCRLHECNFGNLVTDAMVYYSAYKNRMNKDSWTTASIALYNAGNIRNSINITYGHGNITKGELMAAFPFKTEVVSVVLKGSVMREALEHTVESYENNYINAQFLQISGLRVVYDLSKQKGHRVVSVMVRCSNCSFPNYKPLNESADYTVVTIDFVQNGGDGFKMIKDGSRNLTSYGMSLVDLLLWYFKLQSPVYPEVQGRIKFLNSPNSSPPVSSSLCMNCLPVFLCLFALYKSF